MAEDRGPDVGYGHAQLAVARPVSRLEQGAADPGQDGPIGFQPDGIVDVALRNAATQMTVDVLQILWLRAVDIAQKVEVVVVFGIGNNPVLFTWILFRNSVKKCCPPKSSRIV